MSRVLRTPERRAARTGRGRRASGDRRGQIVEAAFRVFSRKGFTAATNREIAEAAGITPGLIYWYFPTKEALFLETVYAKSPVLAVVRLTDELLEAPPRAFFHRVASMIFAQIYEQPRMMATLRFLLAEALRTPAVRRLFREHALRRGLDALARYIARQVDRGTLRPMDPQVAGRLFLGMVMSQVLLGRLLEFPPPLPTRVLVDELVETYLRGVLRTSDERGGRGRS